MEWPWQATNQILAQSEIEIREPTAQDKTSYPLGTTFTSDFHKPEDDKVQAIDEMLQSTNVRYLQCFWVWSVT